MRNTKNIIEILHTRATLSPLKVAFTFLTEKDGDEKHLTYSLLDQKAKAIAARLQELKMKGRRALLLYPPGLDYIMALFGCFYAGVIAVPAYPPKKNRSVLRVEKIVQDAQAKIALTNSGMKFNIMQEFSEKANIPNLLILETDQIPDAEAANWKEAYIDIDSLAFLQYTSGSTGHPKGVMVSHANLLHNLEVIKKAFQLREGITACGWLPPYHDMGLIGNILEPVYCGMPNILMSPFSFLQKPLRWLEIISRNRISVSGGPNFAYDLCVRKITEEQIAQLELDCWEVAYTGAEPVREKTLREFADKFKFCGFWKEAFYPCYGMAESTLFITGGDIRSDYTVKTVDRKSLLNNRIAGAANEADNQVTLISCGRPLEQNICIVNPETLWKVKTDKEVGEIWVSGLSVAKGYWRKPELTKEVFSAYLADTKEGPFLRTGDLGFIEDGELYVTGRTKDLIIIRGQNHYPQDIEWTIEKSQPSLRKGCVAAFSATIDQEEHLVIVAEIDRHFIKGGDFSEIYLALRRMIAEHHELDVYAIVLIQTGSIPKTSSGKIQRHACRNKFEEGSLEVVNEWSPAKEKQKAHPIINTEFSGVEKITDFTPAFFEKWLKDNTAAHLKLSAESIDVHTPFAQVGLDSIAAVQLSAALSESTGKEVSPTVVYDYPNIAALAQYLSGKNPEKTTAVAYEHPSKKFTPSYEPIAVIGAGCRFPGASGVESFWELLKNGKSAIQAAGSNRWGYLKKDIPLHFSFIQNGGLPGKNRCL